MKRPSEMYLQYRHFIASPIVAANPAKPEVFVNVDAGNIKFDTVIPL